MTTSEKIERINIINAMLNELDVTISHHAMSGAINWKLLSIEAVEQIRQIAKRDYEQSRQKLISEAEQLMK